MILFSFPSLPNNKSSSSQKKIKQISVSCPPCPYHSDSPSIYVYSVCHARYHSDSLRPRTYTEFVSKPPPLVSRLRASWHHQAHQQLCFTYLPLRFVLTRAVENAGMDVAVARLPAIGRPELKLGHRRVHPLGPLRTKSPPPPSSPPFYSPIAGRSACPSSPPRCCRQPTTAPPLLHMAVPLWVWATAGRAMATPMYGWGIDTHPSHHTTAGAPSPA